MRKHSQQPLHGPAKPPPWLERTQQRLNELLKLPPNWNSYEAPTISPLLVQAASTLLSQDLLRKGLPEPIVTPTNWGGVVIEWHTRGIDLEIDVEAPDLYHVSFENPDLGEEWEEDIHFPETRLTGFDHRRLKQALDQLAQGGTDEGRSKVSSADQ